MRVRSSVAATALCLGILASLGADAPPAPQLLVHYPFDKDFNDAIGKPTSQMAAGGIALKDGSAVFDGTDDLVEVVHNLPETDLTIAIRFKTANPNCGLFAVHAGALGVSGNDRHMYFKEGKPQQRVWNNETIGATEGNAADGQFHTWMQILKMGGGQQIFLDGKLVASGQKGASDFSTEQGFLIGYSNDAGHPYFQGEIDDLKIWNRPLTEVQIAAVLKGEPLDGGFSLAALPLPSNLPPINPANAKLLPPLAGLPATGSSIAFSPNGQQVAAGYFNNSLRVWTLADGKTTDATAHKGGITAVRFNPAGDQIATAGMDNSILVWANPPAAMPAKTLAGHTRWVRDLAYTPDGTRLVSVSDDRSVRVWNLADGKALHTLTGHTDWIMALAIRADGRYAATASYDQTIRLWDLDRGAEVKQFSTKGQIVTDLAWTADGMALVSVGLDRMVRIWNPLDGQQVRELAGHTDQLHCLAVHPGGQLLATAGADRIVQLWNPITGEKLKALDGPTTWIHGLAWSADGTKLGSIGVDQVVRLWEFPAN
ncbi:MAG: repeat-containing protein [Planctomycetaceae bacterium]|nr:repeat-containing protein [Planctomycetaceae bacterium]